MPKNNFKLFDENKSNMMTDDDYVINQQRLNGVQSGVASSQLQNKTLYQTALMCYALAQLMAANGYDANDADAVSTFVNNLSLSMVQKVVDKASASDVANHVAGKWVDAKQLGELKANIADNYLPLLGGTMLGDLILNHDPVSSLQAATKNYVDGKDLKLYSGQYIGTGSYGPSNPTSVTFPFEPVLFFMPSYNSALVNTIRCNYLTTDYKDFNILADSRTVKGKIKKSADGRTITWYSNDSESAQQNGDGYIYYFAAIGGYDIGATEIVIDYSCTWTVPKTGRYMLELYGGGGGTSRSSSKVAGYSGGASCQHYDSVSLVAGDNIDIVVGSGVKGQSNGGSTSFGSYSVSGGGGSSDKVAGAGAGNYGAAGKFLNANVTERNYGSGVFSKLYGYGPSNALNKSGDGAVYIKYIGE